MNFLREIFINFLESNRSLVVVFFCLPVSLLFDMYLNVKKNISKDLFLSKKHEEQVEHIQQQVRGWNELSYSKRKLLCTSRPNWMSLSTTFSRKDKLHQISVDLSDILEMDEVNMTIRVEPMVTFGRISDYLIPKGYALAVTLEIKDATLGGVALAAGMSTHSHKVGLYQENVVAYELVLGDGSFVTASEKENVDLFRALPWSHGSLGFLVALTLKIEKVKPFVKVDYLPVKGLEDYCSMIRLLSGDECIGSSLPDFIEATIFSKDEAVVMIGNYSDYNPNIPINHCSRWYKPWFYKQTEEVLQTGKRTELIPLKHYLSRHNRSIFWVVESMIHFGNNLIFRLLFGWLLPPKPAFLKYSTTPGIRKYTVTKQVFQDIVFPLRTLQDQICKSEELFNIYPLLVYPCKVYNKGPHSGQLKAPNEKYMVEGTNYAIYNDLGIYGVPGFIKNSDPSYSTIQSLKEMEEYTIKTGGFAFLYADIVMSKKDFELMFDLELYERVRKKYHADYSFPHLFDKVKPEIDISELE